MMSLIEKFVGQPYPRLQELPNTENTRISNGIKYLDDFLLVIG